MANVLLKFGSYAFPSGFNARAVPNDSRVGTTEIPRRHGVAVGSPTAREMNIRVEGVLQPSGGDSLRDLLDDMKSALNDGRQKLYLEDDRFTWATKISFATDYDPGAFQLYCHVTIEFLADTGLWEAETGSSDTWASPISGNTHVITVGGTVEVYPSIALTISGTGTLDVKLAIGEDHFTLQGAVTDGDVITVDCANNTVTLADATDKMSLFDGVFLQLEPGANSLTFTDVTPGTASIASIATTWRNRWF